MKWKNRWKRFSIWKMDQNKQRDDKRALDS